MWVEPDKILETGMRDRPSFTPEIRSLLTTQGTIIR
jgi:hypothetical protein